VPASNYLTVGSQVSYLYKFLAAATFDAAAFEYYWDARQTATTGEMVSLVVEGREVEGREAAAAAAGQPMSFAGPILVSRVGLSFLLRLCRIWSDFFFSSPDELVSYTLLYFLPLARDAERAWCDTLHKVFTNLYALPSHATGIHRPA
jgi:hypothetical protein